MRFAWYVSGNGGRLMRFLNVADNEECACLPLVIADTNLSDEVKALTADRGIQVVEFPYSEIKGDRKLKSKLLSDFMLVSLRKHHIDYCFSTGMHILSGELLDIYRNRIINFHPSLLPLYRGLNAIDKADQDGEALIVGNTAHFIDAGIDTGKIIMQSVIPIKAFNDRNKDYDIILDLQIDMLRKLLKIIKGNLLVVEDGVPIIKGADYCRSAIFPSIDF